MRFINQIHLLQTFKGNFLSNIYEEKIDAVYYEMNTEYEGELSH